MLLQEERKSVGMIQKVADRKRERQRESKWANELAIRESTSSSEAPLMFY